MRQVALDRFGATQNPVVAEQIIKASTLRPADPSTMEKIALLAGFLESAVRPEDGNGDRDEGSASKCYSLALWNHRRGDPAQVIRWGESSLRRSMAVDSRVACVRLLLAMARHRSGETEEARKQLAEAAQPIDRPLDLSSEIASGKSDQWHDWMSAQILLKEAGAMIGPAKAD